MLLQAEEEGYCLLMGMCTIRRDLTKIRNTGNVRDSTIQGSDPLTVLQGVRESPHSHSPNWEKSEAEKLKSRLK